MRHRRSRRHLRGDLLPRMHRSAWAVTRERDTGLGQCSGMSLVSGESKSRDPPTSRRSISVPLGSCRMSKALLRRGLLLALAVLLGAFAIVSVMAVALAVAEDSYANHDVVAIVLAIVLILALAAFTGWLARRSWRSATRRPNDPS